MFKLLHIENFQSHRDTLLEFDSGVNVIVGTSLNGKTAILRALNMVLENRPSGAKFYSHFAADKGSTEIDLIASTPSGDVKISLEKIISRKKDKSKKLEGTNYSIDGLNIHEDFAGVDRQVPDKILDILNVGELNLQRQFDQPFLIMSSAGEFARTINRVTKLEDVDTWVSTLTKRTNTKKTEVELLEGQAKAIEIELANYIGFEDLQEQVRIMQSNQEDSVQLDKGYTSLDNLLAKIEIIDEALKKMPAIDPLEQQLSQIQILQDEIELIITQDKAIQRAKALDRTVNDLSQLFDGLELVVSAKEIEGQAQYLAGKLKWIENRDQEITNLSLLSEQADEYQKYLTGLQYEYKLDDMLASVEDIDKLIKQFEESHGIIRHDYIEKLKQDKKCPICLSDIDAAIIKKLEKSL